MLTYADKVGGSKKGQQHADVILEWSPTKIIKIINSHQRLENCDFVGYL